MSHLWQNLRHLSAAGSPVYAVPLTIAMGVTELRIYVDASTRRRDVTGLGLVIRDATDALIGWHACTTRGMTNNEAEYEALLFGLRTVLPYRPQHLLVHADSQVVIDQMNGASAVRSQKLAPRYRQARQMVQQFAIVRLRHIPREWNVLADAMAEDAVIRDELRRQK